MGCWPRTTRWKTGTKKTRVIKREVPKDSFFRFFSPPKAPEEDEDDEEVGKSTNA